MGDWRKNIETEAAALYVKSEKAYDANNSEEVYCFASQLVGMAKYSALIGDNWTKIPLLALVDGLIEYIENNPLTDSELIVHDLCAMVDEIRAITV